MDFLLGLIGTVLTWTWWLIVPILLFVFIQQYRRRTWQTNQRFVTLQVSVPKENEKPPVAAEQMFAAIHGIYRNARARFFEGSAQEHAAFEIVSQGGRIYFFVAVPEAQKSFIEGQVYAQYPKAEIKRVEDYVPGTIPAGATITGTELRLTRKDVYPIKTFLNFEDVDPLSGITAVMADLKEDEQVWVQLLARPADDGWHKQGEAELNRLAGGGGGGLSVGGLAGGIGNFVGELFKAATTSPEPTTGGGAKPPVPVQVDEAIASGIREKSAKLGYEARLRLVVVAGDSAAARSRLNSAIGAFKQYNTTILNGFQAGKILTKPEQLLEAYRARSFSGGGYVLNIEELASIFHLPNTSVETPTISWTASSKGEPPENLPVEGEHTDLTTFGETNFRDHITRFGVKTDDRRRHIYAIGKTGMGKTNMLENMVLSDIRAGRGLAVVDPHGDFIETILDYIPSDRVDDVIAFNPADRSFPIAFNILEKVDRDAKPLVASGVVGVFEKIYGHSWGPRLEHILRNTILALLDYPDSTLLDVPRMLADAKFRERAVSYIEDPVVKNFWNDEFANYTDRQRVEAIAPIQNKVGQFLSSSTIRNIVGQQHTAVNMREVMDSGKILLLKLSKGELGEDAAALLGAMIITKIQLAAMSRADIPEAERRDFYLYVDEFQNFATTSFATILSESRKYKLNLAIANQYIAQIPEEVRDAVFGNVGTIISFRVGAADAQWLAKEFEPVFTEVDVVNLDKYHIYLKLAIDGVTGDAFSAQTIPLPTETTNFRTQAIENTRAKYASARDEVEARIVSSNESTAATTAKPLPLANDDQAGRQRRFQSYLDKERIFAEKGRQSSPKPVTQPSRPSVAKSAPEPALATASGTQKQSPNTTSRSKDQASHLKTKEQNTAPKPKPAAKSKPAKQRQTTPSAATKPQRPKPVAKPLANQNKPPAKHEISGQDLDDEVVIKF